MDTLDEMDELVKILQAWRDVTNATSNANLPPIEAVDVLEIVNEQPEMLQEIINLARMQPDVMGLTDHLPDDFTPTFKRFASSGVFYLPISTSGTLTITRFATTLRGRKQFLS